MKEKFTASVEMPKIYQTLIRDISEYSGQKVSALYKEAMVKGVGELAAKYSAELENVREKYKEIFPDKK